MSEEKQKHNETSAPQLSEADMLRMARQANAVSRRQGTSIDVNGKKWPLRPISMKQGKLISDLSFEAVAIQEKVQEKGLSARKMKRLNGRLRKLGAKMAAHYVVGMKRRWWPFYYAYMWRKIYNEPEEVSATINLHKNAEGDERNFYLANLECLKLQLVLSMRQVGEAAEEMRKRKESADSMLDEDALPKKAEDSKSGVRSKRPRTTKK